MCFERLKVRVQVLLEIRHVMNGGSTNNSDSSSDVAPGCPLDRGNDGSLLHDDRTPAKHVKSALHLHRVRGTHVHVENVDDVRVTEERARDHQSAGFPRNCAHVKLAINFH